MIKNGELAALKALFTSRLEDISRRSSARYSKILESNSGGREKMEFGIVGGKQCSLRYSVLAIVPDDLLEVGEPARSLRCFVVFDPAIGSV